MLLFVGFRLDGHLCFYRMLAKGRFYLIFSAAVIISFFCFHYFDPLQSAMEKETDTINSSRMDVRTYRDRHCYTSVIDLKHRRHWLIDNGVDEGEADTSHVIVLVRTAVLIANVR